MSCGLHITINTCPVPLYMYLLKKNVNMPNDYISCCNKNGGVNLIYYHYLVNKSIILKNSKGIEYYSNILQINNAFL